MDYSVDKPIWPGSSSFTTGSTPFGYFDDRDGIYFEQVGSDTANGNLVANTTQTLNWVIRSYTGNTANEANVITTINGVPYTYQRRVPQSDWNVDKCDGTVAVTVLSYGVY